MILTTLALALSVATATPAPPIATPDIVFTADNMDDPDVQATIAEIKSIAGNSGIRIDDYGIVPPDRFNHVYNGHMKIHLVDYLQIDANCGGKDGVLKNAACAFVKDADNCDVVLPIGTGMSILNGTIDALFYHERGHAELWAGNHPLDVAASH